MRRYVTHISEEDFRKLYPDVLDVLPSSNCYYKGAPEPKPFVVAVHNDGDTYFNKHLNVFNQPIILLSSVRTVRRTRDYFEVFDGTETYKIKKSETKALYKITD